MRDLRFECLGEPYFLYLGHVQHALRCLFVGLYQSADTQFDAAKFTDNNDGGLG